MGRQALPTSYDSSPGEKHGASLLLARAWSDTAGVPHDDCIAGLELEKVCRVGAWIQASDHTDLTSRGDRGAFISLGSDEVPVAILKRVDVWHGIDWSHNYDGRYRFSQSSAPRA